MQKKVKTQKNPSRSKLVKKADSIFSAYIRLRDADKRWYVKCPLCWVKIHWKKAQNMHFITRSCWLYRYDEDNCHAWCMRCNVMLNGNYIEYTRYMQLRYGISAVDEMRVNAKKVFKLSTKEIQTIIEKYTHKVQKFSGKLSEQP